MTNLWDKFRWLWVHLLWLVPGLIFMIDPRHIEEFAQRHEAWSGLIMAAWAAILAWATRTRPQASTSSSPTNRNPGRAA